MRLYPLLRLLAFPTFVAYMGVRQVTPEISISGDLILFNLVGLLAALSAFASRSATVASAILAWTIGSTVSSWNSLVAAQIPAFVGDLGYILFYPLLFFALMRTLRSPREENRVPLLDSLITAVGLSSILSILALAMTASESAKSNYEVILANFYPIADVLLVATSLVVILRSGWNTRNSMTLLSLAIFATTDFIFLIQSADGRYQFGSFVDSGWLIATMILAESQWHRTSERIKDSNHPLLATIMAAIGSGLVIAWEILRPERLPDGAMIPAFATLFLAFLRMALALTSAERLSEVSFHARTDELTGLANRRHFLEALAGAKVGDAVILIDLNDFKPVNDNFGHGAGDELLRQVALRLSRTLEKEWTFARLGGDEFGLLVCNGGRIEETARSISAAFSYPFHLSGIGEVSTSAAIGVALADETTDALRRADLAMYQAKRSGEAIAFWSDPMPAGITVSPLVDRR